MDTWNITYPAELEEEIMLFKEHAPPGLKAKPLTIVLTGHGLRSEDGNLCAGISSPKRKAIYLDTTSTHWIESKTSLTWHELGHYVLDRRHDERFFIHPLFPEITIPESVMTIEPEPTDQLLDEKPFLQEYYLNELFSR